MEAPAPEAPADAPAEAAPEGNKKDSLLMAYYNNPIYVATTTVGYSIATRKSRMALQC